LFAHPLSCVGPHSDTPYSESHTHAGPSKSWDF
jgi:hypothetical protein